MGEIRIDATNEKGICMLKMAGHLDANNAAEAEEKLFALRRENPEGRVMIDAQDLKYISSAGLRVLLKLEKSEKERLQILNVSDDLFEIFTVTGFSELMSISKPLEEIDVDGLEVVGRGMSGTVYRISSEQIVKVFSPHYDLAGIERERLAARTAFIRQVPTAIPFKTVKSGTQYGLVFELLHAKTLTYAMNAQPERVDEYLQRFVELAKKVHSVHLPANEFTSMKEMYKMNLNAVRDWYSAEEMEMLTSLVESIPEADTMIHGDLHTGNVMVDDNDELILIDMGGMGYGHPFFDLMSMVGVYASELASNPEGLANYHGIPAALVEEIWERYMRKVFPDADDTKLTEYKRKAMGYTCLQKAFYPAFAPYIPSDAMKKLISMAMQRIRDEYDWLMSRNDWDEWKY